MDKVQIISDGTPFNTHVFVLKKDTEELIKIPNIASITWRIGTERVATAQIDLLNVEVEVIGDLDLEEDK